MEHLVFDCRYSRQVWRELRDRAGYEKRIQATWGMEVEWIKQKTRRKGVQAEGLRLLCGAYIYWLWAERNRRICKAVEMTYWGLVNMIW